MQSSTVSSKNVMANREALDSLSTTNVSADLLGCQGIDGNETADILAKEGVELTNDKTENVPISLKNYVQLHSRTCRKRDESGSIETRAKRRYLFCTFAVHFYCW